jgi:hypothetical protein
LVIDLKHLLRIILVVVTLSIGVIVLLSYVFESDVLMLLRSVFVEWSVIVIAFAMLLGVLNVLRVHAGRIQHANGTAYSVILIFSFLIVFVPGIMPSDRVPAYVQGFVGPTGSVVGFIYQNVQRPLQAALFSLMAFFIATAAWRAFRVRSPASLVMFIATLLVLLGSIKINVGQGWRLVTETKNWALSVPVMAGARGILLGIVLGTIVTGLRLLSGIDRPYSD